MKFGSLFSGIGGFDLGFERAGMECIWQCEIDQNASEVLAHHWPEVKRYTDVRTITKENTEPVELICGGFPCQDVSVAGKRAGLAGKRSGLWFEFHRIIAELRPQWVVIENVPGLLSSNRGADFAVVLRGLGDIGYLSAWRVLDSQYFGVAQRRRRVFVVASLGNGRCAEVLFELEGLFGNPPSRTETRKIAPALSSSGAGTSRVGGQAAEPDFMIPVAGTLDHKSASANRGCNAKEADFLVAGTVSCKWAKGTGGYAGDEVQNLTVYPINTMAATRPEGSDQNQQSFGVGDEGDPMFTLQENHSHAVSCNYGVRRLTPTECARLQGFPDDWNGWLSDSARYRQFGNAVTVNVAEWIGKRIMEALK